MTRLAAVDAQTFWMSAKVANDQFLLYAFAGEPGGLDDVLTGLRRRAGDCPDLRLRIADDCAVRYPRWVVGDVEPAQFVVHRRDRSWAGCLDAVARLAGDQLDATRAAWRLHVYCDVHGAPGADLVTVAVLQVVHALADGTRAAELAAWLFGRNRPVPPILPAARGCWLRRSVAAGRAHRRLVADVAAGALPPPAPARPPLATNAASPGPPRIRTLVRSRGQLNATGDTVTVAALTAIGTALSGYLRDHGEDVGRLGAEVPMANAGPRHAHNHFHNVGIGLHADAARITAELRDARRRAAHPAMLADRQALAAVPAPLLRWGVSQFDPAVRVAEVTGNTVVSSVYRGPRDLRFGAAPVLLTAGYPALSPMMAVTHGVHGIGDTIALSVHAAGSAIAIDDYLDRLAAALG